ncbi:MAG: YraN family protein [Lachnospiraceae bacterium]|nr:YraN family protein [Lachnospiraceae bacterium]
MKQYRKQNNRAAGAAGEELAAEVLRAEGYEIVCRNFRNRLGEIDIIAREGGFLVFIEVKYRKGRRAGDPLEAVGWEKQRIICRMAGVYLSMERMRADTPCRFDVVSITEDEVRVIRGAFEFHL